MQAVGPVRLLRVDVPGDAPVSGIVGRWSLHDARRVRRAADRVDDTTLRQRTT